MKRVSPKLSVALTLLLATCAWAGYGGDGVKIETFPEHSRIFLPLDPTTETQLKPTPKGFDLFIKGVSLSDLGAPLGEETQWAEQFSRTRDPRLQALKFSEVSGGVRIAGAWKFPTGKKALANPKMEIFDFRENSDENAGTGYVLDFWVKKGTMTLAEYKVHQEQEARLARLHKEEQDRHQLAERRLASEKRRAEVEDTTRFCKQPLSESTDVFLQFYPIHKSVDFRRWFPSTTPDEYTAYAVPTEGDRSDDARYVRLALDLYNQGKVALVLRTLDFFDAAHPHSEYRTWMRFLRANAMIKLGLDKKAEVILQNLIVDSPESPVSLHSAMYIVEKQIERQQTLASTQTFLWLIAHFPKYEHAWRFHLGAAESLYALRQTDRALKEYEWVAEKAPDLASRAEGALRAPDLYMERFQYAQALAGYYQALHYFPDQATGFASVYLNRAESLYGLGQYDRAKEAFQTYLKDFSIDPAGWRATYRLGEIEGRQAGVASAKADKKNEKSSRDWFYETVNRYPFSPGSTLARLRLIPCGDHGGFDYSGAERFFDNDVQSYNADAEVDEVPFRAMATLSHVRALVAFGKETQAVDLATDELSKPGNMEMHEILKSTLGSVFRKSILDMLAQGQKYQALTFYKAKAAFLAKTAAPEETDYLLKLSQAASDLGLGDLAQEISDAYVKANPARRVAAATQDLDSILESSEQHFTAAKALWVSSGRKQEAAIREQLGQVHEESPFSYQRELILALMDQGSGSPDSALSHAVKAQLLKPEGGSSADPRVSAWIAGLQADAGGGPADWRAALDMYKNLEKHIRLHNAQGDAANSPASASASKAAPIDTIAAALGVPPAPTLGATVMAEGRLMEKLGRWGEAAALYSGAISEKIGGDEATYQYARSLQRTGTETNAGKAREALQKLAAVEPGKQDDFWKKLAREALADGSITMEGGRQ